MGSLNFISGCKNTNFFIILILILAVLLSLNNTKYSGCQPYYVLRTENGIYGFSNPVSQTGNNNLVLLVIIVIVALMLLGGTAENNTEDYE